MACLTCPHEGEANHLLIGCAEPRFARLRTARAKNDVFPSPDFVPCLPNLPDLTDLPGLPNLPGLPALPGLISLPSPPDLPALPAGAFARRLSIQIAKSDIRSTLVAPYG